MAAVGPLGEDPAQCDEAPGRLGCLGGALCSDISVPGGGRAQAQASPGPSLAAVYGAEIAGSAFPSYTDALKSKAGVWDEATLTAFLSDPEGFAEGTAMTGFGIADPELVRGIVAAFKWFGENVSGSNFE